jgi:hypothetical protein
MRMRKRHAGMAAAVILAFGLGACGDDGETGAGVAAITEDNLPPGYEKTPTVTIDGKEWTFDNVPGHYWKVLDDGYAVGLHFQSEEPFKWAEDVPEGELLYTVSAIPGNCGNGSFETAVKSEDASVVGKPPPGYDHWHGLVGAGPKQGHWLSHTAVRDFTLAGPPGNPMAGTTVEGGATGFMPVCDIR